ncbi:phosphatase PAP2 family protein [Helicobacter saguini]|uniref:Phosphatase PAP2 family protein n=1 Tax=Helicobacter saguini TaxID=1548018 RepID=A0A347VPX1_9HELI|nr:phosphatase PAP2 family protein [Helicobacter saguini]MWV61178.1 phosphatase PAP2 family protein [Helicobacter saguini]MWV68155.1 phosphatase PAP2 family protein [Helicobacter saguini]MWV70382.1 phosphatase PAP2 family protein [Helicobacter saguini]MWV72283.1 phosphatase PAP2 family protein [Helicobacter saguini]TLD95322.1 phosphatase PAP2 family protein [Helicobacter saguini]
MKKLLFFIIFFITFSTQSYARGEFEKLGDILTLAPVGAFIVSIGIKDYEGAWQVALGSLATQGAVELIKRTNEFAAAQGADILFSKRPLNTDYKGMPSGHTAGGFSAAGYVYYRYGWKPALPVIALGVVTAASRVHARKHTILQTIVGGSIAWGFAYLFTTKYIPQTKVIITPDIGYDDLGGQYYGVNVNYRF